MRDCKDPSRRIRVLVLGHPLKTSCARGGAQEGSRGVAPIGDPLLPSLPPCLQPGESEARGGVVLRISAQFSKGAF